MNHIFDKSGSMSQALAKEITGGIYRESEKLPGERKLCEYFKVSRTTVRAVLNDFEQAGIITRKPRSGAYIAAKAIEIIERELHKPLFRTFFIMPPIQQTNPLIRTIFSTFLQYINPEIQTSILFQNELRENMPYLGADDVAVIFGMTDKKQLDILNQQVAKLIILNRRDDQYDYISPDNYAGGKLMAEYLLDSGHQIIGCPIFSQENSDSDFSRRYCGLKETLEKHGTELDTFFIRSAREFYSKASAEALKHFLRKSSGITAVACMSDKIAVNIYAQINSHGMLVADDLSVVSFDDQYYAQYTCPPLCSVKYPAEALGIHLANALNEYLTSGSNTVNEVIEPVLIKRQSVKQIRR